MTNSINVIGSMIVVGMSVIAFLFILFLEIARLIKNKIIANEYKKIKETKKIEIEVIREKIEDLPKQIEKTYDDIKRNIRVTDIIDIHYHDKLESHLAVIERDKKNVKETIEQLNYYKNKLAALEFEQNESEISKLLYVPEKYNTQYKYINIDTNETKIDFSWRSI